MQQLVSRSVLCALFLLGAFAIIVIIRNWEQIDFEFNVSVMDVLTLSTTIFLAWWVAGKLEKGHTEERFEKQLIIDRLEELNDNLTDFKKWIDSGNSFLATLMESKLTEYRSLATNITSALSNGYSRINNDYKGEISLPGRITMLKQLCTFVPTNNQNEISLVEEEYIYNSDRMMKIDKLLLLIKDEIFQVQLKINKE